MSFVIVFVEIPWKVLVRPNDDSVKVISPLLHIATKLSSEPQVRKVRMRLMLVISTTESY